MEICSAASAFRPISPQSFCLLHAKGNKKAPSQSKAGKHQSVYKLFFETKLLSLKNRSAVPLKLHGKAVPLWDSIKSLALTQPSRARLLAFAFGCRLGSDSLDSIRLPALSATRVLCRPYSVGVFVIAFVETDFSKTLRLRQYVESDKNRMKTLACL